MAYQSHHCSATLLCSTCISVFLHTFLTLYVLLCLLCSVRHVPSMHHSSSVYFSCCTLPPSTRLNHSQQQPHLFFVLHSYSLCAPCASYMHNPSACSTHRHCFSHRDVHSTPHCHHFTPSSINTLSLFCMFSSCRVLFLIIMAIPQLFWRLYPCVHHHWVLC
jgi:hypothetical protein